VNCGAFAPDGQTLATGGYNKDPVVRLWNVATGRQTAVLDGHDQFVFRVVFTPDGKTLAASCTRAWSALGPGECHPAGVDSGEASGSSRSPRTGWQHAGRGSPQGPIYLLDIAQRKVVATLQGHDQGFARCVLARRQAPRVGRGTDLLVKLWDVSADPSWPRSGTHRGLHCVQFAPTADDRDLLHRRTIRLWDTAQGPRRWSSRVTLTTSSRSLSPRRPDARLDGPRRTLHLWTCRRRRECRQEMIARSCKSS